MKYIVVASWSSSDCAPCYNGSNIVGAYETDAEALAAVARHAGEWPEDFADGKDDEWKPGYQSDPESRKWSDRSWSSSGFRAWWVHGDNWDAVETFVQDADGHWRNM